jgi:hypothetical protein
MSNYHVIEMCAISVKNVKTSSVSNKCIFKIWPNYKKRTSYSEALLGEVYYKTFYEHN